jgi:hypothetical protein
MDAKVILFGPKPQVGPTNARFGAAAVFEIVNVVNI